MKAVSVALARRKLANLIEDLEEGPVVLLQDGQPCAALIGLSEHFDQEAFSLGRNRSLRKLIDDACRRTDQEGGIPFSEILKEVEKKRSSRKDRPGRGRAKRSTVL